MSDNNNAQAPAKRFQYETIGTGIVIGGGVGNVVLDNTIDQEQYGIIVIANPDRHLWVPADNRVLSNTITNSSMADLALAAPAGPNNCFAGNTFTHTLPVLLEQKYPCDSALARLQGGDSCLLPILFARMLDAQAHRPLITVFPSNLPALQEQP